MLRTWHEREQGATTGVGTRLRVREREREQLKGHVNTSTGFMFSYSVKAASHWVSTVHHLREPLFQPIGMKQYIQEGVVHLSDLKYVCGNNYTY